MSTRADYQPPYAPAERVFASPPPSAEYGDRFFMVNDPQNGGYWLQHKEEPSRADGYTENRDEAGVWQWRHCWEWTAYGRTLEMLPLPIIMKELTAAERDIPHTELGKLANGRILLIKDKEGKYCDIKLQGVMERSQAPIYKVGELFADKNLKEMVFELLTPPDASTGGVEMQEVVCYAEAQRQEDKRRFLVKSVKPDEVNGYSYFSGLKHVSRKLAQLFDKKELRRQFDGVPKSEIVIELLKPLPLSKMEDFFKPDALALIKASPKNELIRGFMLSKLKVMPPAEADTFEKIQEWVIWNCEKKGPRPLGIDSSVPESHACKRIA